MTTASRGAIGPSGTGDGPRSRNPPYTKTSRRPKGADLGQRSDVGRGRLETAKILMEDFCKKGAKSPRMELRMNDSFEAAERTQFGP
jgi:hypothetical protein